MGQVTNPKSQVLKLTQENAIANVAVMFQCDQQKGVITTKKLP